MTIRTGVIAAAILLAACGNDDSAAAGQARSMQERRLDVAGVRPGASASEVTAVLERAGWRTESFPGKDWAAEVAYEAARQRDKMMLDQPRRGVETIRAEKGDEEMIVEFAAVPAGSVVRLIRYSAPLAGRTSEQVRAQMAQRYGQPTKQSKVGAATLSMTWCTPGDACRSYYGAPKPALLVENDAYNKLKILMTEGGSTEEARKAQLLAAAGGSVPAKSSF